MVIPDRSALCHLMVAVLAHARSIKLQCHWVLGQGMRPQTHTFKFFSACIVEKRITIIIEGVLSLRLNALYCKKLPLRGRNLALVAKGMQKHAKAVT